MYKSSWTSSSTFPLGVNMVTLYTAMAVARPPRAGVFSPKRLTSPGASPRNYSVAVVPSFAVDHRSLLSLTASLRFSDAVDASVPTSLLLPYVQSLSHLLLLFTLLASLIFVG
ncbi:hypothetical protein SAY87_018803 [Trapa incisa]|uniref:Uncharacterized protein n=1 Tax=Trapa incisa TaxID=236973 RepID=A0AAN7Q0N9_9MYRT|nr:hypothetical protein SAY87_018803 [Trapa incisa]